MLTKEARLRLARHSIAGPHGSSSIRLPVCTGRGNAAEIMSVRLRSRQLALQGTTGTIVSAAHADALLDRMLLPRGSTRVLRNAVAQLGQRATRTARGAGAPLSVRESIHRI